MIRTLSYLITCILLLCLGCVPMIVPNYLYSYLEKLESIPDSTKIHYISSARAFYHPFFEIGDSEREARINFSGVFSLSDSSVVFVPDSIQNERRLKIKSFIVKTPLVQKSYINGSNPITLMCKSNDVTYLFFISALPKDTIMYQNVFKNSLTSKAWN